MNLLNATIYQRSNDPESPRTGVSFSRALLPLGRLPVIRADPERPECGEASLPLRLSSIPCIRGHQEFMSSEISLPFGATMKA